MSTRKKTAKNIFRMLPFLSSKEKGGRKHTESLSEMLYGLKCNPVLAEEQQSGKNEIVDKKKVEKKAAKKQFHLVSFVLFKEKRRKKRTEGLSKTLYDLGLNDSPVQDQYAKTRASVQKGVETKPISSSLSSSLPVSLL